MSAFFLSFLSVALAMFAGREAVRVARLSEGGMAQTRLVGIAALAALVGAGFAAWLAGSLAPLVAGDWRAWLVAAALLLAALEVLLLGPPPPVPSEATASLGATALVLLAGIVSDASGLVVLSIALATGQPLFAGLGGALAAAGVLAFAAIAGADWERMPRELLRWIVAAALMTGAVVIAFLLPEALT